MLKNKLNKSFLRKMINEVLEEDHIYDKQSYLDYIHNNIDLLEDESKLRKIYLYLEKNIK